MGKISRLAQQQRDKRQAHGAKRKQNKQISDDWKPVEIPDGFNLIIDTREQRPLFSTDRYTTNPEYSYIPIVRRDLPLGDYSIHGLEDIVAIERKQQSDFESYIGKEYTHKTLDKLRALSRCWFAGLVIESDEYTLYEFPISPSMTREKVRNQLASINTHYGIHTYINSNRKMLELWVMDRLVRVYEYVRRGEIGKRPEIDEFIKK